MALIDKASLLMVPSTYEAGTLYNVLPSGNRAPDSTGENSGYDQTRADFTFDRGSNAAATRIGSDGLIKKYRENLLTYSNDFSNAAWTKVNASVASGQADKDGGTDAWKISSSASGSSQIFMSGSNTNMKTHSIYAKAGSVSVLKIWVGSNKEFDLSNGTTSSTNSKITDVGNGWYRCEVFDVFSNYNPFFTATAAGDFVYIQNAQLESGLVSTDVLTSGATTAKAGVLIDLPRINYDANGENGALLLEPSRQQLVPYSELFSTAVGWSPQVVGSSTANVILNYGISPDGYQNADRLQLALNGSSYADWVSVLSVASGTTYTYSVYAKSLSGNVDVKILGGTPTGNIIKEITTEWTRLTHTFTATSTALYPRFLLEGGTSSSADILVFGAMLEAGSYSTSYIPNHGTSSGVTRAADSCSVTGVSDVIGQTEGTLYIEFDHRYMASYPNEYIIDIEDSTHKLWIRKESAGNTLTSRLIVSGSNVWTIGISATDGIAKIALAYKSGDSAVYYNGTQIGTSSATYSGSSFDDIYFNLAGSANPELKAKNLTLFKERLSNAELATLTTL